MFPIISDNTASHISPVTFLIIIIIIFSGHVLSNHHHLIIHHIRLSCPSYLFVALMLLKGRYPVPAPDEPNIRPPGSLQQLTPYMSIVLHTSTPYMSIMMMMTMMAMVMTMMSIVLHTPTPYMSILHTPGAPSMKIPCTPQLSSHPTCPSYTHQGRLL